MPVRNEQDEITGYVSEGENGIEKVEVEEEITPDSPCPCGSGKKYKNCCGRV
ncbi:SEC-C metal-binding domain-containing protein [Fusobacterium sp. HC1336]